MAKNRSRSIYKQIFKEYDADRDLAEKKLIEHREKVYSLIPRVKEIDQELALMSIDISKSILITPDDTENLINMLMKKNMKLIKEKNALLTKYGYSNDFLKVKYKCESCHDTGFIATAQCHCLKQKLITKAYAQSNLKEILGIENFDNFDIRYYSESVNSQTGRSPRENMSRILSTCLNFTKNFEKQFANLLFYGSSGLGKTFLCNCIAKELLDKGKTVLYLTAFQLFKMIENNKFNKDETEEADEYLDYTLNVDLFILDDLGTEFSTVLSSSELFNLINARLIEKKSTLISTNLAPKDWVHQYSDRIVSRIQGNYTVLKFMGDDIRIKKKYKH